MHASMPVRFSKSESRLLDQFAYLLADHPEQVRHLLAAHGRLLTPPYHGKRLLHHLFQMLGKKVPAFQEDLLTLLATHGRRPEEDAFVGSLLAGTVGSVAEIFASKHQAKAAQQQASAQTLQTLLAYKAQQEARAAALEATRQSQAGREKLAKMVGSGAAIGIAGWFFLVQISKQNKRRVRPGEVRPGRVRPGRVRPGVVRPGEVRPGEVRHLPSTPSVTRS